MKVRNFFILMIFASCNLPAQKPTEKELAATMQTASFDKSTIDKFSTYQILGNILNKNIDTILAYAKSKNTVLKDIPYFEYYYNSVVQNTNIKDLPQFVYVKVDSLWKIIGENKIISLIFFRDKTITINIKIEKRANNTIIAHQLIWNIQPNDNNHSFDLFKDTLLIGNCVYRLGVFQNNNGWQ